jgi:hypothetical protein
MEPRKKTILTTEQMEALKNLKGSGKLEPQQFNEELREEWRKKIEEILSRYKLMNSKWPPIPPTPYWHFAHRVELLIKKMQLDIENNVDVSTQIKSIEIPLRILTALAKGKPDDEDCPTPYPGWKRPGGPKREVAITNALLKKYELKIIDLKTLLLNDIKAGCTDLIDINLDAIALEVQKGNRVTLKEQTSGKLEMVISPRVTK